MSGLDPKTRQELIEFARLKRAEKEARERMNREFESEHFGVTEEEYEEIQEKVESELAEEENEERERIEASNKPKEVIVNYKISVENVTKEPKQESEERPVFEWVRNKKKEGDKA